MNYYNEHDPKAAAWLRELIKTNLIPKGIVDERSITDVQPGDLAGYVQCHFFAGIGGWSLALRLAGWPDDKPVWTGSCPCQPFSCAGKGLAEADERHLWPTFGKLIRAEQPPTVFGEQVASAAGREWLAGVFADLEGMDYQRAAADLCAAGIGAPHIRQRLYWVAESKGVGLARGQAARNRLPRITQCSGMVQSHGCGRATGQSATEAARHGGAIEPASDIGGVEHTASDGREQRRTESDGRGIVSNGGAGGMADASSSERRAQAKGRRNEHDGYDSRREETASRLGLCGPWDDFDLIPCRDGKSRRIESGTFPLAHGVSGRVGLLRGYGNAIVPQLAAEFIRAFTESEQHHDVT